MYFVHCPWHMQKILFVFQFEIAQSAKLRTEENLFKKKLFNENPSMQLLRLGLLFFLHSSSLTSKMP